MELGTNIDLPGIMGANPLLFTMPDQSGPRRVKIYLVPQAVSADRYFISITNPGGIEIVPPGKGKDTVLLADYHQDGDGNTTITYVNKEVENA